ncbi:DNA polymerase III subunit alpha [uncultured Porphyromonas sp.]|uniref:DNA polymerase III subunit alpha n=1 Tax=uncultured Porphyromonas sp. TaxID=159274 RepID=UPI00263682DF|nr:DNA polymerase III subunit alpha [uncultured Porphyromonas sp.]
MNSTPDSSASPSTGTRMYVPLHVHSHYSILDGMAPVEKLIDKAVACGMPGIALTDHGAMYGIKNFTNYANDVVNGEKLGQIKALRKQIKELQEAHAEASEVARLEEEIRGIEGTLFKAIIGCEVYVARRSLYLKDKDLKDPYNPTRSIDRSGYHLILLAKNLVGYRNLIKMVSIAWEHGEYYKPRIDKELLAQHHEGIIASSACLGGEIAQHILHDRLDEAREAALWYKQTFGEDYYLEIMLHPSKDPESSQDTYTKQLKVAQEVIKMGQELGIKVIATNDTHFLNEEDAEAHDHLICMTTNSPISDPNRMRYTKQEWLKSPEEMTALFADYPDVLENTLEVCDKVEYYSIDHAPLMPHFELPDGFDSEDDYLRHLTYEGAKRRYGDPIPTEVVERIDMELGVIKNMGFPGYFLVVQDFIAAARKLGVRVGPGRGSAAGSAVAYCLSITQIEPIKYGLLFERFLNPDRISMPDIDIDFDDKNRWRVLEWVTNKYGRDRVSNIITLTTMATKGAVKGVARVEELPLDQANRLCKLIPDRPPEGVKHLSIDWMIKNNQEFREASVSQNTQLANTIRYASQLEGTASTTGVHACGVIISGPPISDVVPLSTAVDPNTNERKLVAQYEGKVIEPTGLIKMDFLGLQTLSIINDALDNIKESYGIDLDIDSIPVDDPKTFELYSRGDTVGTFQFESPGMRKYLQQLEPTEFKDLVAMNALYRPGPMDNIPTFIERKHGRQEIAYDLPEMEPYLKDTYGITVYQEQVMILSRVLGDFTRGDSDSLRKAMGKKKEKEMAKYRIKFVENGVAKGHPRDTLERIYDGWQKFASYAFNKSHSVCYAWVAYQTAYLKAHYPAQFMAALLTCNQSKSDKLAKYLEEVQHMGLEVKGPDINESFTAFSANKDGVIRFGLGGISHVGLSVAESIIAERREHGPYEDIYDFFQRIDLTTCSRRALEALVLSGAFDGLGIEREVYFAPMPQTATAAIPTGRDETFLTALMQYGKILETERTQVQASLFGDSDPGVKLPKPIPPKGVEPWSHLERLTKEQTYIGMYLSAHPLDPYAFILEYLCNCPATDLDKYAELGLTQLTSAGLVTKVRQGISKRNEPYAIIHIEDASGAGEIPLFSKDYVNFGNFAQEGLGILVKMTVTPSRYDPNRLYRSVQSIQLLSEVAEDAFKSIQLTIDVGRKDGEEGSSNSAPDEDSDEEDYLQTSPDTLEGAIELGNAIKDNPGNTELELTFTSPLVAYTTTMYAPSINPGKWLLELLKKYQIRCTVQTK